MSYQGLRNGLSLVQQWRPDKGVMHGAVLAIGNHTGHADAERWEPVLIHVSPSRLRPDS